MMKKALIVLLLCIGTSQLSHAQAKLPTSIAPGATKDEQEILDLSKNKWNWTADKKVDELNGLFAENCVFVQGFTIKGGIERDGVLFVMKDEKEKEARVEVKKWLQKIGMVK